VIRFVSGKFLVSKSLTYPFIVYKPTATAYIHLGEKEGEGGLWRIDKPDRLIPTGIASAA
jgi:hypothetical protein